AFTGITFYLSALGLLIIAILRGEWTLAPLAESSAGSDPLTFRLVAFLSSIPFIVLAFLTFSGNMFTSVNLSFWFLALTLFVGSLWLKNPNQPSFLRRLSDFFSHHNWQINISRWTLLILAATALIIFFRVYHIQQTPAEPFSDHAEKILDVYDVSQGQTHIFFPRNTGREAIQMYWTLLMSWIFGTGLSFLSLKIGTVLFGLLTLPYIYLLGKEIGGARVGLIAFVFAGIGYWPNVIARIGLRFPLYPLFVAPAMYYLIRGLRTRQRNDFILSGLFLGLGLHGYSPSRIVPFLVAAAIILYILHAQSKGARRDALLWFIIVGLTSLIVFLPLLRYATENPDSFSFRALSRLGAVEQPLSAPWYQILLSNTWNALRMFNWDDGNIWVNSLPHRPALDVVSGALFLIGIVLLLTRYIQKRHWLDLFLLLSIPILLLPSILSLAFPDENPALNRAGGALVPVFVIVALALDGLLAAIGSEKKRTVWVWLLSGILLLMSASQNYDLVFRQFDQNFRTGAWNSSEMGAVIKQFGLTYGETDTVWIVPFPYWVDTRLPGVWAGIPNRDFAMWRDDLPGTVQLSGPKLFMVKANPQDPAANDQETLDVLRQLYPQGSLSLHQSSVPGHDFWIYFVPAQ
ncbi:MAG: glycosyltransferase family 39 protein, partial [Chloroflexi bacterium]|nr:glycosyltransferase family 39 protein [Chloroflexota bacterium]